MRWLAGLWVATAMAFGADAGKLESIFAGVANADSPGFAVLVRQDGRTVFERGYGVRELRSRTPIDAATDFRLASFTKQFTAMSVMLLVHDGKLRYDQTLDRFFPGFPAWAKAVTVRHLLTHTAGLPDYEDLMEGGPWTKERQIQDAEALELIRRQAKPKFAAGTSWSYSNSAYVVLGLIVAKVSGQRFPEFLQARIFGPVGMRNTIAYVKGTNTVPNRAFGHSGKDGGFVETDQSSTSATLGDGGVYSNLQDLAKWDAALAAHTLLSEAEMKAAITPAKLAGGAPTFWPKTPGDDNLAPGKPVEYGFGWFLDSYRGHSRMWHSGTTTGFRTIIDRFPREKLTIVILANRSDLDVTALALKAADAMPAGM